MAGGESSEEAHTAIVEAIRKRALLQFNYKGHIRIVAPYCFGVSTRGEDVLRAVQVRGSSASNGMGFGKLWTVTDIAEPRVLDEGFTPDDPHYNPDDSAMTHIYCRVERSRRQASA
ncbi:MAG TPA: hypothetical protein VGD45_15770 [Steroidobacter sp.]|uniref:hypothetical protein n=1 Tax=Steroidobacter sp. TaxID=1978227 RepID=UPI002ED7C449